MPPKACKLRKDKSGTEYTLNRIPLGGFCALKGDDPSKPDTFHAKDSFISAKLWKKLIIMVGGVAMNLLTARVIFTLLFRHGTQPLGISGDENSKSHLVPSINFLQEQGFLTGELKDGAIIQTIEELSLAQEI